MMRFHLSPKVAVFFTLTPLLLATAVVKVPCPACGGRGYVSSTPAMARVSVLETRSEEQQVLREACNVFIVFKYDVTVKLLNEGEGEAQGWIKMVLVDTAKEEGKNVVDAQYAQVDIPPLTVSSNVYKVVFGSGLVQVPQSTEVRVEALTGDIPDAACGGTGRIALNAWPFVNGLKANFNEKLRATQPYQPPVHIDWSQYKFFNQ